MRDRVLLGRGPQPQRPAAGRLGRPARRSGRSRTRRSRAAPSAIRPRHVPRANVSGAGRRAAQRRRAAPARARTRSGPRVARAAGRRGRASSLALLSASVASSPAYRRVRTPGPPPSASTSMPGIVGQGRQARSPAPPNRALIAAFVSNVSPSSTGSPSMPELVERHELGVARSSSSSRSSRSLCSERVATSSRGRLTVTAGRWRGPSAWAANRRASPASARSSRPIRGGPVERLALGRALELDVGRRRRCRRR